MAKQRDTVKCTISPQPSPTGRKVMQITVSAPPKSRTPTGAQPTAKAVKPAVKAVKLPPPPTVEVGETVESRAGVSLARVCTGSAARMIAGRAAEIAGMADGSTVACYEIGGRTVARYEIGAIILRDKARVAEARARGIDPRGFVPSWDAPRSSDASEDSPKLSFAAAENTTIMNAHNARVQPLVDRISAHNALVGLWTGTGIAYPGHNNGRKARRKCRTYGVCAARRPKHHACQLGCVNIDTPTGTVGAVWRNRPVGRYTPVHGPSRNDGPCCRKARQHCPPGQIAPPWRLIGDACENVARKARAKFQKETARNFRGK